MNAPLSALQALLMTQEHRLYKLTFPHNDGPSSAVFLENFDGVEKLNSAFEYKLKLISDDAHIELKDFMGKLATVELEQANTAALRYFNGYVTSARHAGSDGGLSFYELVLSPWTTLLQHRRDHYIFHNQDLVATLEELFADYGDYNDHKFRVANPGPTETFRVQYDESDANYFNRRVEEKGWSYWFEHRADGHTLVISDDTTTQALPIEPIVQVRFQGGKTVTEKVDFIDQWNGERSLQPSKVAVQSFDFKQPHFPLYSEQATNRVQGKVLHTEVFEYTGALAFANTGAGNDLAALRLEEFEARAKNFQGAGNHRALVPGRYFELTEHFEHDHEANPIDNEFLLLSVTHSGSNNYLQKGVDAIYRNRFTAMRRGVPYRPGRHANSRPVAAPGIQTAIVVGPPGEEIHCDEFGRVKVQFHWDRAGNMDDKSSCWVRVSSPWAGTNYGGIQLPRIGQEVIVDFLNGNIDQPIIVGRTYNQAQMPPWELPAQKNQSGFYSKSIGGGYDNANVLRFDDTAAAEELWLHAEKNQLTEVENDEKKWVGNDRVKTIDRDETSLIKRDRTETVDHDEKITIHNDRTERVDHNEKISIGDNRAEDVGINETISIGNNRSEKVGNNEDVSIGSNRSKTVGSNEKDKIGKNWSINVGKMKTETIGVANIENIGMARMSNIGMAYSLNVGMIMNTVVGMQQSSQIGQKKTLNVGDQYSANIGKTRTIEVGESNSFKVGKFEVRDIGERSETKVGKVLIETVGEHLELSCGAAKIVLKADGGIFFQGTHIEVMGGQAFNVDAGEVHINDGSAKAPPAAPPKEEKKKDGDEPAATAAPSSEGGESAGSGAPPGSNKIVEGAGSSGSPTDMIAALEKGGGGVFGMLNNLSGIAQQVQGAVGQVKQISGLFKRDKSGNTATTASAALPAVTQNSSLNLAKSQTGATMASISNSPQRSSPIVVRSMTGGAAPSNTANMSDEELNKLAQDALFGIDAPSLEKIVPIDPAPIDPVKSDLKTNGAANTEQASSYKATSSLVKDKAGQINTSLENELIKSKTAPGWDLSGGTKI
jgi:type VI secretion system secreted protein VgrG